ncbi:hypothetical protein BBOMB_1428 [Bifidobacterium bombi DSM 19703]|uniref:Uncharacterized protein n=1 Tax=Bifidobacterium bombi DSM 19703 TaxID=1341695 RepID=A0A086BNQ4_9BIFI|nr:hypothetical protein BBOMB_1428 [Bifidobacterium bombi DSM 19703]
MSDCTRPSYRGHILKNTLLFGVCGRTVVTSRDELGHIHDPSISGRRDAMLHHPSYSGRTD